MLEVICGYAFAETNITSIVIPASVRYIEDHAFFDSSLSSITFAEGSLLEGIGYSAFENTSITSIIIPASVMYIEEDAFKNNPNLTISAEANEKPSEWSEDWNSDNRPVIWGYTGE